MGILSGWIKEAAYKKTSTGYKKVSRDTSADSVFFNDGKDGEEKILNLENMLEKRCGSINLATLNSTVATLGTLEWQRVGDIIIISINNLKLRSQFNTGNSLLLYIFDKDVCPTTITQSTIHAIGIPLYLTLDTSGNFLLQNYSGQTVPAESILSGQIVYVIK